MSKNLIQIILAGVLGGVLAYNGMAWDTWGFWAVVGIVFVMRLVGDE